MKWILVYITITGSYVDVQTPDKPFDTMIECFEAREYLAYALTDGTGTNYPIGSNAICIQVED